MIKTKLPFVLAATMGVVLLTSAVPARADDDRDEKDARQACREIAKSRDWDDTKVSVERDGKNRIIVSVTGEHNGGDRMRRCVYNTNTGKASFE